MSAATRAVATANGICNSRFRQGDFFVWLYRDERGRPSSWERYTVRAGDGDTLVLDMASKFEAGEPYNTHHRMRFRLANNLLARESCKQWSFDEFAFSQDGAWLKAPHRDNVQAFEEKFNVFLMPPVLPLPANVMRSRRWGVPALGGDVATLVQSSRHAYTNSWYIREPRRLAGVAGFKAFSESVGGSYTFELIAVGNTDNTDSAGPLNTGSEAGRSPFG